MRFAAGHYPNSRPMPDKGGPMQESFGVESDDYDEAMDQWANTIGDDDEFDRLWSCAD